MYSGRPRLIDLFCGAGGCSVGYHRAGFDVVGIDLKPQKRYPFPFIQGDAMRPPVDLASFDAIHASPPCQRYSVATKVWKGRSEQHPDLVGETRDMLRGSGRPWVMENVRSAPFQGATMLCGTMFGLRVLRHRLFEGSFFLLAPPHTPHPKGNLTNAHRCYSTGDSPFVCLAGHNFERKEGEKAMGIDWMGSRYELAQAIPPAYTEYIGRQLMQVVQNG